ncbi:MAG: D-2-hydroxyacid dehydrogenase, partial [Clostridiales bacterium]|nr:D-2-hydroxyacid dehydrogenase [Clostridiales bacterium]
TKGIHGPMISDQALAFIFAFLRGVHFWVRGQKDHRWVREEIGGRLDESFNKTVGVVGVGSIGTEVCRKCKALGMRVVGAKRTRIEAPYLDQCFTMDEVDQLFAQSDFIVLTCPLTPETTHLINENSLKGMKPNAVVINLARGAVVDHEALVKALDDRIIAGAGLDIFETEPLPADSPLWDHENIIISHHTAPKTPYLMDRAVKVVGENLVPFLKGEPLNHVAERK